MFLIFIRVLYNYHMPLSCVVCENKNIFKKYNTRVSFFMCIFVVYNLDIDRMTN